MRCVHDLCGVLLQSEYDYPIVGLPIIRSLRALDSDYKPCGPELMPLLDRMLVTTGINLAGQITELSPVISLIVKEYKYD